MPRHTHDVGAVDTGHEHTVNLGVWNGGRDHSHGGANPKHKHGSITAAESRANITVTETAKGSGNAHNNMPPYVPVLYLIKVKDDR